jgi:hypothetical protein
LAVGLIGCIDFTRSQMRSSTSRSAHDADIAFSVNATLDGDLRAALRDADFNERLSREHTPPVTQYRLGDEDEGFYAEFLTPLRGDGLRRDGQDDVTMAKAGITAQRLRYLELLLLAPWSVEVGPAIGVPVVSNVAPPGAEPS